MEHIGTILIRALSDYRDNGFKACTSDCEECKGLMEEHRDGIDEIIADITNIREV